MEQMESCVGGQVQGFRFKMDEYDARCAAVGGGWGGWVV
jgi:hypothetical protein